MQRPVIIVPGYYGSELVDIATEALIWVNLHLPIQSGKMLDAIRIDEGAPERVKAGRILDSLPILPFLKPGIYSGLRHFLMDEVGYRREEVFTIGIDWRQSVARLADDLQQKIQAILNRTGAAGADVIAHSHGGLAMRAYLAKHGGDSVHSLISVAVPHKGMFKTMQAVIEGFPFFGVSPSHLMKTARTFPSAYELLPNDVADGLFTIGGAAMDPCLAIDWAETPKMQSMLGEARRAIDAIGRKLVVPTYVLYGTHQPTLTSCTAKAATLGAEFTVSDLGDGTVPMVSGMGRGLTSATTLRRYAVPFADHMSLFNDPNARLLIKDILLERRREAYLAVQWNETMYRRDETLQVAAALYTADGDAISDADVRLTIGGTALRNEPMPRRAATGSYDLTVQLQGVGGAVLHPTVTATSPSLSRPITVSQLLMPADQ